MLTEEEGIQAIIALQKMVGITETVEMAQNGWRSFNDLDKLQTENMYKLCVQMGAIKNVSLS